MNLPAKIYTEKELARAKRTSKMIGWVQGGGAVVGAAIVLNLLGWIPTLLVVGGVAWVLYKLLGSDSGDEGE